MKKLQIITLLAITSFMIANAQENNETRQPERANTIMPVLRQAITQEKRDDAPRLQQALTGDKNIDSQVMALNKEMEEKIKAIREEYVAKIKALVGDKKPVITRGAMMGTTTPPGMMRGEKRGMDEGNKLGRPMMGTTTEGGVVRPIFRDVKSEEPQGTPQGGVGNVPPKIIDFFRGFFGGNK